MAEEAEMTEREILQLIQQNNATAHSFLQKSMEGFQKRNFTQAKQFYNIHLGYANTAYSYMLKLDTQEDKI